MKPKEKKYEIVFTEEKNDSHDFSKILVLIYSLINLHV